MRLGWVQSRTDGCPILIARYAIRAGSELYGRVPILIALYAIRVGLSATTNPGCPKAGCPIIIAPFAIRVGPGHH